MSFPKLYLPNKSAKHELAIPVPSNLQSLSDWETNDEASNACISFWQYVKVLLVLDDADAISVRAKKVLKELYFDNTPLTADQITDRLGEKDKIVIQGQNGLGGFAKIFLEQLKKEFPALKFPEPYTGTGNVFIQVLLDLILGEGENIYFCLRSRFRAALSRCFGDDVIRNW